MSGESPKSSEWSRRRARIEADGAREALRVFGFDVDDERAMQEDMLFLRRMRTAQEKVSASVITAVVSLVAAGISFIVALAWRALTKGN